MKQGFTLIEILIAITISVVVIGVGAVRYRDFNRVQTVRNAGATLKNNIRDIQSRALSQIKPQVSACTSTCGTPPAVSVLTGYNLSYTGLNTIKSEAVCSCGSSGVFTTYTLPQGLVFHSAFTSTQFQILGQGATQDIDNIQIRTEGTVGSDTQWYAMCISTSGDVKDSGGTCGYSRGSTVPNCNC